jgi:dTDP-4-amino-4,6-dideoxygalactose transaminase
MPALETILGATPEPVTASEESFSFIDLQTQYSGIKGEVLEAVTRVLDKQHFILGQEVSSLESEIGQLIGARFGVGCGSGSDALMLALMAVNVGSGDEVITTPFTFIATAGSIARLGATPVFVDIDPETFNLDWRQLEAAIRRRTKAIIPVHLFGLSAEMSKIMEISRAHGVPVIEDAAQAIGGRYKDQYLGNIGTCGCFSFFPSKNLGGAGDGGMVTTNAPELADRLSILRAHGSRRKYYYEVVGVNSRLDALQAAILRVKLKHLPEWTEGRRCNAHRYRRLFSEAGLNGYVTLPTEPTGTRHVYNQFSIRVQQRDRLREHLRQRGIPTEIYYPLPLHLQSAFSYLGYREDSFPEAESASRQVLALPIFAELTEEQQKTVVTAISEFYATKKYKT